MKPVKEGIKIQIMGKEFAVACEPDEKQNLLDAARYLDESMHDIQKSGKIIGNERLAVMVALNMANELLDLRKNRVTEGTINARLEQLQQKIDNVIKEDL
ncbi:MAG: cell division protein ZapA [Arenicella sp.]